MPDSRRVGRDRLGRIHPSYGHEGFTLGGGIEFIQYYGRITYCFNKLLTRTSRMTRGIDPEYL